MLQRARMMNNMVKHKLIFTISGAKSKTWCIEIQLAWSHRIVKDKTIGSRVRECISNKSTSDWEHIRKTQEIICNINRKIRVVRRRAIKFCLDEEVSISIRIVAALITERRWQLRRIWTTFTTDTAKLRQFAMSMLIKWTSIQHSLRNRIKCSI